MPVILQKLKAPQNKGFYQNFASSPPKTFQNTDILFVATDKLYS